MKTFEVGDYWTNGVSRTREFYRRLQATVQKAELEERVIGSGANIIGVGPCRLVVLSPEMKAQPGLVMPTREMSGAELNNRSLVTRLDCGQHSLLFTADAEQQTLDHLQHLPGGHSANIVKVPHHGAKSSLHHGWINQIEAQAMVVSVGLHNRYGHPASEVVAAYEARGIPLYRTDQDGAIIIEGTLSSSNLQVSTTRQQQLLRLRSTKICGIRKVPTGNGYGIEIVVSRWIRLSWDGMCCSSDRLLLFSM